MRAIKFSKFPKYPINRLEPLRHTAARLRLQGFKSTKYCHKQFAVLMSNKDFLLFSLKWS